MYISKKNIDTVISQGSAFLKSQQQKDGSFLSLSSADQKYFTHPLTYHALFSTTLIFKALHAVPETGQLKIVKDRIAFFLLSEKSRQWSFNYWVRKSPEAKTMPYPDDLDDTFCALAGLWHHNPKLIDGAALAYIVQLLITTEVKEGGPYRTWLVGNGAESKWKDVDIAVNSNIAYFLSLQDISLPSLNRYIDTCIATNKLRSPYYPSVYPIIYFLSRFYKGRCVEKLRQILLAEKEKKHNALDLALIIISLVNLGTHGERITDYVASLVKQQKNGFWQPYPFYIDVSQKQKTYYGGSAALTTALCLEAFAKYRIAMNPIAGNKKETREEEYFYSIVTTTVKNRLRRVGEILKGRDHLFQKNTKKEIAMLPYFFAESLGDKKKIIPGEIIKKLCIANVFGWIAYSIYDDFLDDQGDPRMLSLANTSLRELTVTFEQLLPNNTEFRTFFHGLMDQLDRANAWEVTYCRIKIIKGKADFKNFVLPDYKQYEQLAQKSLGHGLGPLALVFVLGYKKNSPEIEYLLQFLTHYLIARQLHDDTHDWEKDLAIGHINAVGTLLLQELYKKELEGNEAVSLRKLFPKLQKLFWKTTVDEVCMLINKHTNSARMALQKCTVVVDRSFFEQLLVKYEKAAQMTLEEKQEAINFLKVYK